MRNGAEDVEHKFTGRGAGVEAFLQRPEFQSLGTEPIDGLQQLLERAAQPVEADHADRVAFAGEVDHLGQAWSVEGTTGDDVLENADRPSLDQTTALLAEVLVGSRYSGIADQVGHGRTHYICVATAWTVFKPSGLWTKQQATAEAAESRP